MSLFAQTITGKFDTADLMFFVAFLCAAVAVIVEVVDKSRFADVARILVHVAIALIACAFWVS